MENNGLIMSGYCGKYGREAFSAVLDRTGPSCAKSNFWSYLLKKPLVAKTYIGAAVAENENKINLAESLECPCCMRRPSTKRSSGRGGHWSNYGRTFALSNDTRTKKAPLACNNVALQFRWYGKGASKSKRRIASRFAPNSRTNVATTDPSFWPSPPLHTHKVVEKHAKKTWYFF